MLGGVCGGRKQENENESESISMTSLPRTTDEINIPSGNGFIPHEEAAAEAEQGRKNRIFLTQPADDDGFAQCFKALHGNQFVFTPERGWVHRSENGTHWVHRGADASLVLMLVKMMRERSSIANMAAANDELNASRYDEIIKKALPNNNRVTAIKSMLQSLLFGTLEDFDNNPDELNCKNCVVNLRTGKLTPHSPEQKFTYCIPVDYKPNADHSQWASWLTDTVGEANADYLRLAVGYSLTGHTWEEILFYLFGPTRSGKGTFTETINCMLGDSLSTEVSFGMFTSERGGDNQNFDLAPLKPCRVVLASESEKNERFNGPMVKSITGGNKIYCAFKHKEHFNYRPQFKIWLSSNLPVNADPDDDAVWGRVRVITFPNSHLGKENKSLKDEMKSQANLEGVLAWAVEGAIDWYKLRKNGGLPELDSNAQVKQQQRDELDEVQNWIDECCVDAPFTAFKPLYQSYERWCDENGVSAKHKRGLTQALRRKGYTDERKTVNGKQVRGISGLGIRQI